MKKNIFKISIFLLGILCLNILYNTLFAVDVGSERIEKYRDKILNNASDGSSYYGSKIYEDNNGEDDYRNANFITISDEYATYNTFCLDAGAKYPNGDMGEPVDYITRGEFWGAAQTVHISIIRPIFAFVSNISSGTNYSSVDYRSLDYEVKQLVLWRLMYTFRTQGVTLAASDSEYLDNYDMITDELYNDFLVNNNQFADIKIYKDITTLVNIEMPDDDDETIESVVRGYRDSIKSCFSPYKVLNANKDYDINVKFLDSSDPDYQSQLVTKITPKDEEPPPPPPTHNLTVVHRLIQNDGTVDKDPVDYGQITEGDITNIDYDSEYSDLASSISGNPESYTMGTGDDTIYIDYYPGRISVTRGVLWPKYEDDLQGAFNDSKTDDLGYIPYGGITVYPYDYNDTYNGSYMSGEDNWGTFGYNTDSKGYGCTPTYINVYFYYESRYLSISKYAGNYDNKLDDSKIPDKYSGTKDKDSYISFKDKYDLDIKKKIYYSADANNDNYVKYNLSQSIKDSASWSIDNASIGASKDSATNDSNTTSYSFGGMNGDVENHADAYRIRWLYAYEPSVKIYVRHLVKNGASYSLADSSLLAGNAIGTIKELYEDALQTLPNNYSERKSSYAGSIKTVSGNPSYSEYYEIDKLDYIYLNRMATIIKDGEKYNCTGFKKSSGAMGINDGGLDKTTALNLRINGSGNTNDTVYIDYYYDKENYSTSLYTEGQDTIGNNSKLSFVSVNSVNYDTLSDNDSVSNNVVYVPASESLRPYLISEICRPRNLKYSVGVTDNNVSYNVNNYTAYGIDTSSTIPGNINNITGTGRNNVYNVGNSTNIYLNDGGRNTLISNISNTLNTFKDAGNISNIFKGSSDSSNSAFSNILNGIKGLQTQKDWFTSNSSQNVNSDKLNGLRNPTAKTNYKEYNVLAGMTSGGTLQAEVTDTRAMDINVYTPFKVDDINIVSSGEVVNHTVDLDPSISVIQQNADFDIKITGGSNYTGMYSKVANFTKYLSSYYLRLDFDIKVRQNVTVWIYDETTSSFGPKTTKTSGSIIPAKSIIFIPNVGGVATLLANAYSIAENTVRVNYDNIKVYASTINRPDENFVIGQIQKSLVKSNDMGSGEPYVDNERISMRTNSVNSQPPVSSMNNDAFYICSKRNQTISVGRIFDFEITDCLDLDYKNVFRKSNTNTVNDLTGIAYFSGTRRLLLRDTISGYNINYFVDRENLKYGYVTTTLPIGPYKNTSNEYIKAPKLGYKIAFDLKTSGYYEPEDTDQYGVTRKVKITPSYYYISKDGDITTYNDNIGVYFKNSSSRYQLFENSGFTVSFKPNDGYRNVYTDDTTPNKDKYLSKNIETLNISKAFELDGKTMMTTSDHGFIQSWYGEFKLPNSTIVVAKDSNGNVDMNKPLTNGYIGVKFDIQCIDEYTSGSQTNTVVVSYNQNNKNDSRANTTQWDYEGYLGYDVSNQDDFSKINLKLESKVLKISDNAIYNKIKGTVVFYDIDNRAAMDFN